MPIRLRKLVGAFALIILVFAWSLLAMALAQWMLAGTNGFVQALYYVIAGLGWVLPAMPVIAWMQAPGRRSQKSELGGRKSDDRRDEDQAPTDF